MTFTGGVYHVIVAILTLESQMDESQEEKAMMVHLQHEYAREGRGDALGEVQASQQEHRDEGRGDALGEAHASRQERGDEGLGDEGRGDALGEARDDYTSPTKRQRQLERPPSPERYLRLLVQDPWPGQQHETEFKIKKTTRLGKLFEAYCRRNELSFSQLLFKTECGKLISPP